MQLVELPFAARSNDAPADAQAALAGVIGAIGEPGFDGAALQSLNRWMPLAWWSVYTLSDHAPPSLHAHGSSGAAPDGTGTSWEVYRAGLYRRDASFAPARDSLAAGRTLLLHRDAAEMPDDHRQAIYTAHGLRERVSIVTATDEGLLAINFYRHQQQDVLGATGIAALAHIAEPLLACVRRHIGLSRRVQPPAWHDGLPRREREVCERLLKGWTHDGIAADLGLTAATVKTYRDRAFRRLDIRYRHELFARAALLT